MDGALQMMTWMRKLTMLRNAWNHLKRQMTTSKRLMKVRIQLDPIWSNLIIDINRGHRELLDGRLCRPDSEQRPLLSNFTTVAMVKLCCHNFTQIANFMIFFVSTISYRPTDLSLLIEFSKNVILKILHFSSNFSHYDYSKIVLPQLYTKCIFHDFFCV